jgi:hypothetical protein
MLFAERTELRLVRQSALESGVLVLTYEPA